MRIYILILFTLSLVSCTFLLAQQKISTTTRPYPGLPMTSAILELESADRGLLLPRLSETEKNAIATPVTGLIIYNTTKDSLQYYANNKWVTMGANIISSVAGCPTDNDCDNDGTLNSTDPDIMNACVPLVSMSSISTPSTTVAINTTITLTAIAGTGSIKNLVFTTGTGTVTAANTVTVTPGIVGDNKYTLKANNCISAVGSITITGFSPPSNTTKCAGCGPSGADIWVSNTDDNSGSTIAWASNTNTSLGLVDRYDGRSNQTKAASLGYDASGAFKVCKDKGTGWYLPSQIELALIYGISNGAIASPCLTGFTTSTIYWPSTEADSSNSWYVDFSSGCVYFDAKAAPHKVRCVWRPL